MSKFNPRAACVNLVAPASHIDCLLYLPNVRAIQYKLGPARKFKCTTAARDWRPLFIGEWRPHIFIEEPNYFQ